MMFLSPHDASATAWMPGSRGKSVTGAEAVGSPMAVCTCRAPPSGETLCFE